MRTRTNRGRSATAGMAALLGALALMALPTPAVAAAADCQLRGSTTLEASRDVRLYRVGTRYYTCAYANGRVESLNRLAGTRRFRALGDLAVAGRYVAFTRAAEGIDYRVETLYVRDARKGRWLHRAVVPLAEEAGFEPGDGVEIEDLVLDSRGRLAWAGFFAYEPSGELRQQVVALSRRGTKTLLDADAVGSPAGIDFSSLALAERHDRSRVYWTHGDTARTALLR